MIVQSLHRHARHNKDSVTAQRGYSTNTL